MMISSAIDGPRQIVVDRTFKQDQKPPNWDYLFEHYACYSISFSSSNYVAGNSTMKDADFDDSLPLDKMDLYHNQFILDTIL